MNLHEYQARDILRQHGIPVPPGEVASTPAEAKAIAERMGGFAISHSRAPSREVVKRVERDRPCL